MRIALFGGTFDPIHSAHLAVAREAATHFLLDRVLVIPNSIPPHKAQQTSASYEDRLRMVELACRNEPTFEASRLEEGKSTNYSIHTIERVREQMGGEGDLFFLIGADAFSEIRTWYRWQEVVRMVDFIILSRPGYKCEIPPGVRAHFLETLQLNVSSTEIRRKLANGERPAELPDAVMQYIIENRLYGFR